MKPNFYRKQKHSPFAKVDLKEIDYTNSQLLEGALTDTKKIKSARVLNNSARKQKLLTKAIKRARHAGFLPHCDKYEEPKIH